MGKINILNSTFKGISGVSLTRLSDSVTYSFPVPDSLSLSAGITEKTLETRDGLGNKARARVHKTGEMPEMTLSYGYLTPELIAFRTGQQLATGTIDSSIPRQVLADKVDIPADTTTGLYFSVVEDATSPASVIRNSLSTALVQQPFSTFDGTTDDSFAVGASGALKFSDNLVANRDVVTLSTPVTGITGSKISDLLVGELVIRAKLVTNNNEVALLEVPSASVNLQGSTFAFDGEAGSELGFYVNVVPGQCRSWNLYTLEGVVLEC